MFENSLERAARFTSNTWCRLSLQLGQLILSTRRKSGQGNEFWMFHVVPEWLHA